MLSVLLIPAIATAILAVMPVWRMASRINSFASLLTGAFRPLRCFATATATDLFLIDDLNIVFYLLTSFVGFTTSIFSASYIAHELETGRLTPRYLRFYHPMYQVMMVGMNLALVADNLGLMWLASSWRRSPR